MSSSAWEVVFMLLVLKIPVVYLGCVVWWAVRAEPERGGSEDGGDGAGVLVPLGPCGWNEWRRSRARPVRARPLGPVRPLRSAGVRSR